MMKPRSLRLHWCILICAGALLPAATKLSGAEDLLTGVAPAPLEIAPMSPDKPMALLGSYGDPLMHAPSAVSETQWHPSGNFLLARMRDGIRDNQIGIWKPNPAGDSLKFQGFLGLGWPWVLSPDGSLLFGMAMKGPFQRGPFGCYRFGDRQGLWSFRAGALDNIASAAFSPDSKLLAVLHGTKEKCMVSLFDATSGRMLREFQPDVSSGSFWLSGAMVFVHDGLLLCPSLDPEGRLTLLDLKTWTAQRPPNTKGYRGAPRLVTSKDSRWVVVWDSNEYVVWDHSGADFREKFRGRADTYAFEKGFNSVALSPDGRTLVVSGNGRHRVIEIGTQKLLHESTTYCMCGVFHPEGKTFWRTCTPFVPTAVGEWSTGAPETRGHFLTAQPVESPDGKWLATQDDDVILVWPVAGQSPSFFLGPTPADEKECWRFQKVAWSADSKMLYAGDSWDFVRWSLPTRVGPGGKLVKIPGTIAFEDRGHQQLNTVMAQEIIPDHQGKWCMLRGVRGGWTMRNLERPEMMQTFLLPRELNSSWSPRFFLPDDSGVLISAGIKRVLYDIASHTPHEITAPPVGEIEGTVDARGWAFGTSANSVVTFFNVQDGMKRLQFPNAQPASPRWSTAQASPDGRYFAVPASRPDLRGFLLYDLDRRELVAFQPTEFAVVNLNFSHDNRRIYTGLEGGAVLAWDVEKLPQSSPPPDKWPKSAVGSEPPKPVAGTTSGTSSYQPPIRTAAMPAQPLSLDENSAWKILEDGSAFGGEEYPSLGRITVAGAAPTVLSAESSTAPDNKSFYGSLVLRSQDRNVLVRRQVHGLYGGELCWVDDLTNLTERPLEFDFVFEACPGLDASVLVNEQNQPLRVQDGMIIPSPNMPMVGGTRPEGGGRLRANYLQFIAGPNPPETPTLKWDAPRHTIQAVSHVKLLPLGRRLLMHTGRSRLLPVELSPKDFFGGTLHHINGDSLYLANWFIPQALLIAGNYSDDVEWRKKFPRPPMPGTVKGPIPQDAMGCTWTPAQQSLGFSSELVVQRGFELWMEGQPAVTSALIPKPDNSGFAAGSTNERKKVILSQSSILRAKDGAISLTATVTNNSNEPVHTKVGFVTWLAQPANVFCDPQGTELPRDRPVAAAQHHGKVFVSLPGANQPAAIFSLSTLEAKAKPTVKLVDARMLLVEYELDLSGGQIVTLVHVVAQRPAAAFGSPANTMANWNDSKIFQMTPGSARALNLNP